MENTNEGQSSYRPRTGSLERRKTLGAPKRAVKSADDEEPRAPRARKEKTTDEAPVKRTSTKQSFFKNRTPHTEQRDEQFDDKPKRAPRKSYGDEEEKPKRRTYGSDSDRPAPRRKYGEQSGDDRPKRRSSFDDKPHGEKRGYSRDGHSDKPFARKPYGDKSPRGDKPFGDKPRRSFDDKPRSDRPYERKPFEKKSYGGDKPYGDKPRRSFSDDKPRSDRPYERKPFEKKSYGGDKPYGDKPRRSFSDDKPRSDRPYERKPLERRSYDDSPAADARRPRRSFDDRPKKDIRVLERKTKKIQVQDPTLPVRLNKFIANSGTCSRREADEYIENGEITVNGVVVTELGTKVMMSDDIRWNGDKLSGEKKMYVLLNKPKGYVTTVEDPHADKTVMDLIVGACKERVYPVGRLDKNTTGVLLFTNDGDLTKVLTHPSYNKRKVYQVNLDKVLKKPDMDKLVSGIELEDGLAIADEVGYTDLDDKSVVGIEIHSGRNRIVRRMFEALGYEVKKLDRVYFAGLTKKSLERGKWRILSPKEVNMLKMGAYE